jgi:hypothetical protein
MSNPLTLDGSPSQTHELSDTQRACERTGHIAFAAASHPLRKVVSGSGRGSLREHRLYSLRTSGMLAKLVVVLMRLPLKRQTLARQEHHGAHKGEVRRW